MSRKEIRILGIYLAAFVIVLIIAFITKLINFAQAIELIIMFVLVGITLIYVKRTSDIAKAAKEQSEAIKQQADASVKMADGMTHPVIDIQKEKTPDARLSEGFAALKGDFAWGLSCKLHNIGVGYAVDVYSFIQIQRERRRFVFGTLAAGEITKKKANISVIQKDNRMVLNVYYKDIYGHAFKSSREVHIHEKGTSLELGELQIGLVEEE